MSLSQLTKFVLLKYIGLSILVVLYGSSRPSKSKIFEAGVGREPHLTAPSNVAISSGAHLGFLTPHTVRPTVVPLSAYLIQGISLKVPEADHKGRVDMSRASLQFNPGPPPPVFEVAPTRCGPRTSGKTQEAAASAASAPRVVWKGMRRFGRRAVLLACARDVSVLCVGSFCAVLELVKG